MAKVRGEAASEIEITQGDTLRLIRATLRDPDTDEPIDLSDSTVAFRMVNRYDSSEVVINDVAASISSPATSGVVTFELTTLHVAESGTFAAWWIRNEGGKTEHFPNGDAFILVRIAPEY